MKSEDSAVIQINQLQKTFKDFWHRPRVRAVRGIDLTVKRGEVYGLLGPNGSGKSTTIKMILGLLYPTSGSVSVLGQPPRDVASKARIGYLPEESYQYPYLTASETLYFYGHLFNLPDDILKQRVAELLEMVGLSQAADRRVGGFSKGMARRIGLAQALINDPDLIILDEPTSGLDPLGCRQVKDIILALAERGKSVLLCSHLLADVEDVCDRIAILYNGEIKATGPIRELLQEGGRVNISLPELPAETMQMILSDIRERLSGEPAVSHPQKSLEDYFIEVIEKARAQTQEASGAGAGIKVAPFLSRSNLS